MYVESSWIFIAILLAKILVKVVDKTDSKSFCLIYLRLEDILLMLLLEVLWVILTSWGLHPLVYEKAFLFKMNVIFPT